MSNNPFRPIAGLEDAHLSGLLDVIVSNMQEQTRQHPVSQIPPAVYVLTGEGRVASGLFDPSRKLESAFEIGQHAYKDLIDPIVVVFQFEAWTLSFKAAGMTPEEAAQAMSNFKGVLPSESPDREEAISLIGGSMDGRVFAVAFDLVRDPVSGMVTTGKMVSKQEPTYEPNADARPPLVAQFFLGVLDAAIEANNKKGS